MEAEESLLWIKGRFKRLQYTTKHPEENIVLNTETVEMKATHRIVATIYTKDDSEIDNKWLKGWIRVNLRMADIVCTHVEIFKIKTKEVQPPSKSA